MNDFSSDFAYNNQGNIVIKPQVLLYTLLLFQFGSGNQLINDGFMGGQSIYVHDWKVRLVNSAQYPLNPSIFRANDKTTLMSDTEAHGEISSSASDITYDKVMWTTIGATGCGLLLAYVTYQITDDILWGYGIGATVGTATGATLVGNTVMEPDGSLLYSTIGSTIGTLVGSGFTVLAHLPMIGYHDTVLPDWYYALFIPAVSFPVIGAVAGYYRGVPENNRVYIEVGTVDDYATRYSMSKNLKIKIGLVLTSFQ